LGLAIAAGLRRFVELPPLSTEQLAAAVGRGRRSAVGTYGFEFGGLIVDGGIDASNPQKRLSNRVALPSAWRFVLVRPNEIRGLAGDREAEAFARLPAVPDRVTDTLWQITNQVMLPAVKKADCRAFGEAVYRFGHLAGECFAAVQGGPFANVRVANLVAAIRGFGVTGVGQSSWGPTVFAVTANEDEADRIRKWLQTNAIARDCEISVAAPNNQGALIES
jgi:beta-RFAP synthase